MASPLPRYAELPRITELGARHAWEAFGTADRIGRIGLLDEEAACRGAAEVRRGAVFNLCLPLDLPAPPLATWRHQYDHRLVLAGRNIQDDQLDAFFPQASSQWDGLRHVRAREFGFFGGRGRPGTRSDEELGIDGWAQHGVVGRGVLADVARHLAGQRRPLPPRAGVPVTVAELRATLEAQNTMLQRGDVLIVRTGFVEAYLAAPPADRPDWAARRDSPGLHAGEEMAEYLWDSGVAAVVADNPAVEVIPGDAQAGSLHRRLIPLLGFALGELFSVGPLAADCAAEQRWTCLFMAAPLNLPGGVGSPANAVAVR